MFEDSLVESRGRLASKSRRWITVGSVGLQCLLAAVIVVVPMVRPEALLVHAMAPVVMVPSKAPVVVVEKRSELVSRPSSVALPSVMATRLAVLPSMKPVDLGTGAATPVPSGLIGMSAPPSTGPGGDLFRVLDGGQRVIVVAPKKAGRLTVSSGVSAGLLLGEIRPVYPRIAVAARVEGIVVIEAVISKAGTIESARVVSGPTMLAGAAIEAVKAARYRPYRLNGEATEVQTTVTVNFRLGTS